MGLLPIKTKTKLARKFMKLADPEFMKGFMNELLA